MKNGCAVVTSDITWHQTSVSNEARSQIMGQRGICIWFTGLSGSGKSTLSNALDLRLSSLGKKVLLLDGDNLRHGLCRDLGMTEADRSENIRRAGEVARLMVDASLIVLCAFISPCERDRNTVRKLFNESSFIEVYVSTNLSICEKRDPKGLYRKARQGLIKNFTGIDSIYEKPENPEITIDTSNETIDSSVNRIITAMNDLAYS